MSKHEFSFGEEGKFLKAIHSSKDVQGFDQIVITSS